MHLSHSICVCVQCEASWYPLEIKRGVIYMCVVRDLSCVVLFSLVWGEGCVRVVSIPLIVV